MKYNCKIDNNKVLHILFEEQVKKTPDSIALVYENTKLTYHELNERSNQLAHYLIKQFSPKPDTLITLCLDRSEKMIITILAVLKSGAAYVPIDPQYPKERIKFIMDDTQARLMITDDWYVNAQSIFTHESKINPMPEVTNNHLAYVIYTSGTTGNPKGVMIEHRSVVNNAVFALNEIYDFTKGKKVTAFASYAFDSSIPEIFSPLLRGGELHVLSETVRLDAVNISNYIENQQINYIYLPPILLALIPRKIYPSLKGVIYAGEPCDLQTALFWAQHVKLYNCYGPTETTVNATYKIISNGEIKIIGKPIDNVQCYILNSALQEVSVESIGELYIGGIGVARGYLNRPELTEKKFLVNPFNIEKDAKNNKLYKTGDLVRKLKNGDLEYIGRSDFQVKIRGFRIELAEIENAINSYSLNNVQITQNVVIAKKHLIAYYVASSKLNDDDIYNYLCQKLPKFMIPSFFVHLEKMPMTINGKIDRNALPPLKFSQSNDKLFLNEVENNIRNMFAEVLEVPINYIKLCDDFFRLGGNSILAIQLATKINNYYQSHLSVADIFVGKNIECIGKLTLQKSVRWQNIIRFNESPQAKNLFMIHPGMGGCEVYAPLVEKLSIYFNCYGVDAYNLYHDEKIENLTTLSDYYLNSIRQIMDETNQREFHLLGWSLGGKIALEIAALLERSGVRNITLYLLDTLLYGDVNEDADEFKKNLLSKGAELSYIEKSLALIDIAKKLHDCELSSNLNYTKVLLFKALLPSGQKLEDYELFRQKLLLKFNHIDQCLKSKNQIKVVPLQEKHGDLLNQSDILIAEILNFNFPQPIPKKCLQKNVKI